MQEAVDLYEEKAHEVAIICTKAGREVYNRVGVPCDAANNNTNNAANSVEGAPGCQKDLGIINTKDRSSGSHCKSSVIKFAKIVKVVIRSAVNVIRVLGATIIIGINGAILIVDVLAAAVLKAIDTLCELE